MNEIFENYIKNNNPLFESQFIFDDNIKDLYYKYKNDILFLDNIRIVYYEGGTIFFVNDVVFTVFIVFKNAIRILVKIAPINRDTGELDNTKLFTREKFDVINEDHYDYILSEIKFAHKGAQVFDKILRQKGLNIEKIK